MARSRPRPHASASSARKGATAAAPRAVGRPRQLAAPLLARVGERVRAGRSARGRTLAQLAHDCGLSRRFLTDLELGRANISLQGLAQVAAALELEPSALLAGEDCTRDERSRLLDLAHALPDASLAAAIDTLEKLPRRARTTSTRHFALVGLRGAGKTTLGKAAVEKSNLRAEGSKLRAEESKLRPEESKLRPEESKLRFVELDQLVEESAGMPLADLFTLHGEAHYRQLERDALQRLIKDERPLLVATGGGIVAAPDTYGLLRRRFVTIWLKASPEDHWNRVVAQGDQRPMQGQPGAMARLREILAERAPLYGLAQHAIDTSALGESASLTRLEAILREGRESG